MSERVVLITGALAGIGRATATAFARQGAAAWRSTPTAFRLKWSHDRMYRSV
jgi:NAD(P)-dependent dehydrogenase (short-subunit alcohol dehydrogenase family)